jgi:hypothetical protein
MLDTHEAVIQKLISKFPVETLVGALDIAMTESNDLLKQADDVGAPPALQSLQTEVMAENAVMTEKWEEFKKTFASYLATGERMNEAVEAHYAQT